MKEVIYYIQGMHCASCELLIEKRLLKQDGVRAVDASTGNGTVRIEYTKQVPGVKELNKWFKSDGYVFSETPQKEKKELLFYFVEGKQGIQVDKPLLKKKIRILFRVFVIFYILYLIEKTGIAQYVSVSSSSSLGVFFLFGLVAGLSSCAALVGGVLLSFTKTWNSQNGYDAGTKVSLVPHAYFHVGRIIAYAILGGILGAFGKAIAFDNVTIYVLITLVVSVVMFIVGLQMAGVRWAERFQIRLPKFITRRVAGNTKAQGKHVPFGVGAGTVLLPCGFTLIAQGIALTSGSIITGSLMLTMFVIGTMIPLLFISVASVKGGQNPKRARAFSFYAGVVLVIFALYNVNGQLNVLGVPSVSDVFESSEKSSLTQKVRVDATGAQVVRVVAKGFQYAFTGPSTIKAGVPTKLIVDDQGILGCGVFLAARGLISGFVDLQYGENVIDLGKPKKGNYKITCSMGMVRPITLRVQ